MRAYIGVTDRNWYRFLKAQPTLDEVNFWGLIALRLGVWDGILSARQPGRP